MPSAPAQIRQTRSAMSRHHWPIGTPSDELVAGSFPFSLRSGGAGENDSVRVAPVEARHNSTYPRRRERRGGGIEPWSLSSLQCTPLYPRQPLCCTFMRRPLPLSTCLFMNMRRLDTDQKMTMNPSSHLHQIIPFTIWNQNPMKAR